MASLFSWGICIECGVVYPWADGEVVRNPETKTERHLDEEDKTAVIGLRSASQLEADLKCLEWVRTLN